jgi:hypothetical protein
MKTTNKMNDVIYQLMLIGFIRDKNKDNRYRKDFISVIFNFRSEYICFKNRRFRHGIDCREISVDEILKSMQLPKAIMLL